MLRRLFFLVLFFLACGPTVGGPCTKSDSNVCAGSELFVCESQKWAGYACPQCSGSACTWANVAAGASCPESEDGQGWCSLDGRGVSCFFSASAGAGVFVEKACGRCVKGKTIAEVGGCN